MLTRNGFKFDGPQVKVEVCGSAAITSDTSTTRSFTGVNIGTVASNRKVVVAIMNEGTANVDLSSVTIGGQNAIRQTPKDQVYFSSGQGSEMATFWAFDDTAQVLSTTATIVLNWSSSTRRGHAIQVFAVYGAEEEPYDICSLGVSNSGGGFTGDITFPQGAAVLGVYCMNINGRPLTWTGLTEVFEDTAIGGDDASGGATADEFRNPENSRSLSVSHTSGSTTRFLQVISYAPKSNPANQGGVSYTCRYVRYSVTDIKGNDAQVQLSELKIALDGTTVNWPGGTTCTANVAASSPGSEGPDKLVDNNNATKYCSIVTSNPPAVTFTIDVGSGNTVTFNRHTYVTGNDFPSRDPRKWTLEVSNNGTSWTTVSTVTGFFGAIGRNTQSRWINNT